MITTILLRPVESVQLWVIGIVMNVLTIFVALIFTVIKKCSFVSYNKCGRWDLNPRTPKRQGPKPCAFDQAWQLPHAP